MSAELTGALLAMSALTHGMSRVIADLVTHPGGVEFYNFPAPQDLDGVTVGEAISLMKERYDCMLVAAHADGDGYVINPPRDYVIRAGDRLLVISDSDPARLQTRPPSSSRLLRR